MEKRRCIYKYISIILTLLISFSVMGSVDSFAAEPPVTVEKRDWLKYASRYHYDTLSENEKLIYDTIDYICDGYMNSTEDFKKIGDKGYTTSAISKYGADKETIGKIVHLFKIENPQYYFLTGGSWSTSETFGLYVYNQFSDGEVRANVTNDIFSTLDSWISEIDTSGKTECETVEAVNEFMIKKLSVLANKPPEVDDGDVLHQSLYCSLKYKSGVCLTYSYTMYTMLNYLGIDTITVISSDHGWNKVYADGKWYLVDTYWNDGNGTRQYLLISDATMKRKDQENAHTAASIFYNPAANDDYHFSDFYVDTDPDDNSKPKETDDDSQDKDSSGNKDSGNNSGNNNDNKQDKDDSKKEPDKPKYSEEWINGKWYNKDGKQDYAPTLMWKSNAVGSWVEDSSGWYPVNQWQKIDGFWYFFTPEGYMASNEYYNGYWFGRFGGWEEQYFLTWKCNSTGWWVEDISGWWPASQWLKIDGCWYYFDSTGYMVSNCYIDGWWIDADGVCR